MAIVLSVVWTGGWYHLNSAAVLAGGTGEFTVSGALGRFKERGE